MEPRTTAALPWQLVPFERACSDATGGQTKVQRRDYLTTGQLPVIDQGQQLVAGYTDAVDAAYRGPLPVVLFGDHTRIFKYVDFPFALGADGLKVLVAKPPFHPKFLWFYFRSLQIPSRGYSRHFKFLSEFAVPVVAPSEGQRIVELLDQGEALRSRRREADVMAERILPALFYRMFGNPAMNPTGGKYEPLGSLTTYITSGSREWAQYAGEGPARFLRTQDVNGGEIADDLLPLDPPAGADAERTRLHDGDVVVTITGMVGKAAVFRARPQDVYVSQHVALVRTKQDFLDPDYLAGYANLPLGDVPVLARFQYGQTKPGLGFRELATARVPIPPLPLQRRFAALAATVRNLKDRRKVSAHLLNKLWGVVLHRAFSGELTAKWREAHMRELLVEMEQQARVVEIQPGELEAAG